MILMTIFLGLSIIFIIGTAIYLNINKKTINKNLKHDTLEKENKNKNKKSKKQLADILQIKIKNNMICLGNRYSSILKLGNIDYNILSTQEQETVENILIQTALSIDYPVQFFSTTEYVDTSKVITNIKSNKTKNEKIKEYQEYLIQYLENLMESQDISVVKNYAIISYDGSFETAIDELNRKLYALKGSLLRAKISCDILEENELYNLLYRELNKNSTLKIDFIREGEKNYMLVKRKKRKEQEINIFNNVPGINDILLPDILEEKKDYLCLGYNKYCRTFVMTVFPKQTWIGWLDNLSYIGNVTISAKIEPSSNATVINQLTRKLVQAQSEYATYARQRKYITYTGIRKANCRLGRFTNANTDKSR